MPSKNQQSELLQSLSALPAGSPDRLAVRNRIVTANIGLVYFFAKKYQRQGLDREDLVQAGTVGLIYAIDRFDTEKGSKLSSYAVRWICREISRHIQMVARENPATKVIASWRELLDPEDHDDEIDGRAINKDVVSALRPRHAEVIRLRFGLSGVGEKSQREVSGLLGISQARVSQIEIKALATIRNFLGLPRTTS